ncbi:MAG: hypothetical protein ACLR2G_03440 [Phascolarctobacterium faecium]
MSDINRVAVAAGVIPDPLTGKVGNMDAGTMVETGEKMAKYGGKVILKAYAKGDINASDRFTALRGGKCRKQSMVL